jgi:hypothetical protein
MNTERTYTSTSYSPEVRTTLAALGTAWKARGNKLADFHKLLEEAGYPVPMPTLRDWRHSNLQHGSVGSSDKQSGRPAALTDDQQRLLIGYVLAMNDANTEVHRVTARTFLRSEFGIDMTEQAVGNYLRAAGFTCRVMQSKTAGYKLDRNHLCQLMHHWLLMTNLGVPLDKLCSIDFTFTGHRTDRRTTYAARGTPQPKSNRAANTYTNCIVTCIWADSVNRTPAMFFTYNQKFRKDRNPTAIRKEETARLEELLEYYEIDQDRVVYWGAEKGEKRTYVSEDADLVQFFFEHYGVPENCTVLSDHGRSFLKDGKDIFDVLGFEQHHSYTPAVHQFLSPNDNRLHGAAKQKWRAEGLDYHDDVNASLFLLYLLDYFSKDAATYFRRNLQLGADRPSLKAVEGVIRGDTLMDNDFYRDCLREYCVYKGLDAPGADPRIAE